MTGVTYGKYVDASPSYTDVCLTAKEQHCQSEGQRTVRTASHTSRYSLIHTRKNGNSNMSFSSHLTTTGTVFPRITIKSQTALQFSSTHWQAWPHGNAHGTVYHEHQPLPISVQFEYSIRSRFTRMRLRCGWSVAACISICAADGSDHSSKF
jgi:hypothetical protein